MFLTRIELDPRKRLARKFLGSPQAMHAVVMKAAIGETPASKNDSGRVLWRVDHGTHIYLYILSPGEPDCAQILNEAGKSETSPLTRDYTPLLNKLERGQVWAFRLTVNPTKTLSRGEGVRGKVYGHVSIEDQRGWLLQRASKFGFDICKPEIEKLPVPEEITIGSTLHDEQPTDPSNVFVVRREKPRFGRRRPGEDKRDRVTINKVVFEGQLRIEDPDLLRTALISGIGRSKAYGCGLMTLAPMRA
ncbi:type I-E CRISPR-associated protein Cas6/Cse3/CasE [Arcanobacterium haemolyticum]|nr:type I-E CRISPR-associated protein Cas6/Cse3/CasE [Arcanobacterium haemolyticum]